MELLEDPGCELTIDDVSSPANDSRFTPSHEDVPEIVKELNLACYKPSKNEGM